MVSFAAQIKVYFHFVSMILGAIDLNLNNLGQRLNICNSNKKVFLLFTTTNGCSDETTIESIEYLVFVTNHCLYALLLITQQLLAVSLIKHYESLLNTATAITSDITLVL